MHIEIRFNKDEATPEQIAAIQIAAIRAAVVDAVGGSDITVTVRGEQFLVGDLCLSDMMPSNVAEVSEGKVTCVDTGFGTITNPTAVFPMTVPGLRVTELYRASLDRLRDASGDRLLHYPSVRAYYEERWAECMRSIPQRRTPQHLSALESFERQVLEFIRTTMAVTVEGVHLFQLP